MKPFLFALTALGALAAAAPALAQGYGSGYQGNNDRYYNNYTNNRGSYYADDRADPNLSIDTRIARLETRINAGMRAGTIDRDEAMRLRAELRDLRRTNSQYGYGGVSSGERADLMERLRSVGDDIAAAEGGSSYGYNDGYDRGSGSGYANGNGYGSSAYGRSYDNGSSSYSYSNSSSNNGYYGRGGPYEDSDGYATLRVGDRAGGNLYGVPYALRNTYRDGYGYYYRSDGQAVYQIDSRTGTVMRVYPMNR